MYTITTKEPPSCQIPAPSGLSVLILVLLLFLSFQFANAQTPGLIVKPASTAASAAIFDPNSDGYISSGSPSGTGPADGPGNTEIAYRAVALPAGEKLGDLLYGTSGGFTDFSYTDGNIHPVYIHTNSDADPKLMFRLRMADLAPSPAGYSILIDTDGKFGNSGTTADPTYTSFNPGFEVEILLASNSGIYLYNINNVASANSVTPFDTLSYEEFTQKSVASSAQGGTPDYFYEFYVPFSRIPASLFTKSTPIRIAASTVMLPESALKGKVADVAGVDDVQFKNNKISIWNYIIKNQVAAPAYTDTTFTESNFRAVAPLVNGGLTLYSTTISGTSAEADSAVITVYKNGVAICGSTPGIACPMVMNNAWSIAVSGLSVNDQIHATVTAPGKSESLASNIITVKSAPSNCTAYAPVPVINCLAVEGIRGIITGATFGSTIINLYKVGAPNSIVGSYTIVNSTEWGFKCHGGWQQAANGNCSQGNATCLNSGSYYAIAVEAGKCNSLVSAFSNLGAVPVTATPVVSTSPVNNTTTSLSGTHSVTGTSIMVLVNGYLKATTNSGGTATGGVYPWSVSGLVLNATDVVTVYAGTTSTLISAPVTITVQAAPVASSAVPVVNGPIFNGSTQLTGYATETYGAEVKVYADGVSLCGGAGQPACPTVSELGTWSVSGLAAGALTTGKKIKATAQAPDLLASTMSDSIVVRSVPVLPAAPNISGVYYEQGTSVSGTGLPNSMINVYVNKALLGTTFSASNGSWTLSGLSADKKQLFAGGQLTATSGLAFQPNESAHSNQGASQKIVQCAAGSPSPDRQVNPSDTAICINSSIIVQVASEANVIYTLRNSDDTKDLSTSVLGTGAVINLESILLDTTQTIKIYAQRADNSICSGIFLTETVLVTVTPYPSSGNTVTASPATICAGSFSLIKVSNSESGIWYSLKNAATDANVGNSAAGNSGLTISLNTGNVLATTSYYVVATNTRSGCSSVLDTTVTVTTSGSATPANNGLTAGATPACGTSSTVTINGTTATPTVTYQLINTTSNTLIGSPVAATGTTLQLSTGQLYGVTSFKAVRYESGCSALTSQSVSFNTICSEENPLPVELINFTAGATSATVELAWTTATETGTIHFEVERSTDGKTFGKIGTVTAAGTSETQNAYAFTDRAPKQGVNYYRLRQVSADEKTELSKTVAATLTSAKAGQVTLWPNPVTDQLSVSTNGLSTGDYSLQVFDLYGHALLQKNVFFSESAATLTINAGNWPAGVYVVTITGANSRIINQVVKQ